MQDVIRILFLADTHLGFDLPTQARIQRRRRGHDFLANYATALEPALAGQVDLVVHGGDVFNRSRVATSVAWQAFEPLARVADRGVAIYVVAGNHERGRIPQVRFTQHSGIHLFDQPRTDRAARVLSSANIRRLAPASMNVEVRADNWVDPGGRPADRAKRSVAMPELPL